MVPKSERFRTLCVSAEIMARLEALRKREEARTGVKLSWTQFFRIYTSRR